MKKEVMGDEEKRVYPKCFSNRKKPSHSRKARDDRGKFARREQVKTAINKSSSRDQVKSPAMNRAEDIQSRLEPKSRSLIKVLIGSNVSGLFHMRLPLPFCRLHLPEDTAVILEDEDSEQFELDYYSNSTTLRMGWRNFAIQHKFLEGDILIFHLVGPAKFKVYVVRANDFSEVSGSGTGSLSNCDSPAIQTEADWNIKKEEDEMRNMGTCTSLKKQKINHLNCYPSTVVQQSGIVGDESINALKDIKTLEDFYITINDSELDARTQIKYYQLCKSRNVILHEHIRPGLNSKLIAGMITAIVSLADAIRACKSTTSRDEFGAWENSLESFRLYGFNVDFLSDRVSKLAFESDGKRYAEAISEHAHTKEVISEVEQEMCVLESKLVKLKEAFHKKDDEIQTLKSKAVMYERKFEEWAKAPW